VATLLMGRGAFLQGQPKNLLFCMDNKKIEILEFIFGIKDPKLVGRGHKIQN